MRRKQWVALLASAMLCVTSAVSPAGGFVSYAAQEENGSTGTSAEEIKTEDAAGGASSAEGSPEGGESAPSGGSEEQAGAGASSEVPAGEDKDNENKDQEEIAADGESAGSGESASEGGSEETGGDYAVLYRSG